MDGARTRTCTRVASVSLVAAYVFKVGKLPGGNLGDVCGSVVGGHGDVPAPEPAVGRHRKAASGYELVCIGTRNAAERRNSACKATAQTTITPCPLTGRREGGLTSNERRQQRRPDMYGRGRAHRSQTDFFM